MGRQMQDNNSDSYSQNHHHPEFKRSLLHIIEHHPLCHHFIKRHAYKKGGSERGAAGIVLEQRYEAFLDDKKNPSLANTRNSNVEEKAILHSSVEKNKVRSQTKAVIKEISKKRSKHYRSPSCPQLPQSVHDDLEQLNIDPFSETVLTDQSTRIKTSVQDATPSNENQPTNNDLPAREIKDERQCRVGGNARKHTSGASTNFCKHFVGVFETINMNKDLLLTFRRDPVSPLFYHFHKQQVCRAKVTLTRSVSCPSPNSSRECAAYEPIGNGSLPKGQGKLHCGNKIQKSVQFESSKENCEQAMPLIIAKWRANGNLNMNEAVIVREVHFSPGFRQSQSQKEIKHIKNLKQKIEHVTKESKKEKLRVAMDSVIHKLPQGQGISDDLKKEILKKLTEPNVTKEGEYFAASCNVNFPSTCFFSKHNRQSSMRRIWSLQEPLVRYFQYQEYSFKTEARHPQSEELKLRTEKACSPLSMPIPLQRILSLPDLQSFSYASQNGNNSDISYFSKQTIASGDGTVSSEGIAYQKNIPQLNVYTKSQVQLDTVMEDLTQEHDDLLISNIEGSGSDCMSKIQDRVDIILDDFGYSSLKNCCSFNVHDIGPIKEYMASKAASDSKSKSGPVDRPDNVADKQEANIDSLKLNEAKENAQKAEILTKQLNIEIPIFPVDTRHKEEFNYVKYVLEISGLSSNNESLSAWHSKDTPVDPLLYEEMESDPDFCTYKSGQCNHHVLFDLINETLIETYGRSNCYPPKKLPSHMSNSLHEVWTHMSKYLCLTSKAGQTVDDHVSRDVAESGELVNLLCAESVGLELEELIFQDLLEEIILDLTLL